MVLIAWMNFLKERMTASFKFEWFWLFFKGEIDHLLFLCEKCIILVNVDRRDWPSPYCQPSDWLFFFISISFVKNITFFEERLTKFFIAQMIFFERRGWPSPSNLKEIDFFFQPSTYCRHLKWFFLISFCSKKRSPFFFLSIKTNDLTFLKKMIRKINSDIIF